VYLCEVPNSIRDVDDFEMFIDYDSDENYQVIQRTEKNAEVFRRLAKACSGR
jgi:hypothetical protein